jgi:HlyD family secretion protein
MFKAFRNILLIGTVLILITAYARVRYIADIAQRDTVQLQDSMIVERGDVVLTVSASGPIRANQELPLIFLATGRVQTVNVTEGQRVLKGQTIATLDTKAQSTALANARLALDGAKVSLRAITAQPRDVDIQAATAALNTAKAQLEAARVGGYDPVRVKLAQLQIEIAKNREWQAQLQRDAAKGFQPTTILTLPPEIQQIINELPEEQRNQINGFINSLNSAGSAFAPSVSDAEIGVRSAAFDTQAAQSQLAQAQNARGDGVSIAQAQAAIVQAQTALDKLSDGADDLSIQIAQAQVDAAQAAVDLAAYNISRSTLTAPFAGVVTRLALTVGEYAPLDRPAVTLVDDSGYYVDIGVDEIDVAKVAVGQKVGLLFDALPGETITGTVDRVAASAVDAGGVVTYPVHILIDPNPRLRAGLSTTATITVKKLDNTLRIRNRFVKLDRKTGRAFVTVQSPDGKFREVEVTLGLRNETWAEIKSGLNAGDVIVVLPRESTIPGF